MNQRRNFMLGSVGAFAAVLGLVNGRTAHAQSVLKFSSPAPTSDPAHQAIEQFGNALKQKSAGRFGLRIFPSGQLGQQREIIQGLQSGAVELAYFSSTHLVNFVPEFAVLDLPYVISETDQASKLLDGEFGDYLMQKLEKVGVVGLGFSEASFRGLVSKRPITGPDSLKGLKVRVPPSPIYVGTFTSMGAIPTPLPWGDLYTALQQGVVDAADSTVVWYDAYKFYEVAPHFTFSNHVLGAGIFLASAKWLATLPEADRTMIRGIAKESALHHRKIEREASHQAQRVTEAKGAKFTKIDLEPLMKATRAVHAENAPKIGDDVMKRLAGLGL